jgi:glycosyltransferase involved in cell wall biosynthesis
MRENKKVALVSPFVDPFSYSNSRVTSIADILKKKGFFPVIITANFDHASKKKYSATEESALYKTVLINVPSYNKNLSVLRVISHIVFAFKVNRYINRNIHNYAFVYSTIPTTLAPYLLSRLCTLNKITFVLDVIDLWPESYIVFFKRFGFMVKFLLIPWFLLARATYRQSTVVVAESEEYAKYVSRFRKDTVESYYLGTDIVKNEELLKQSTIILPEKKADEIWISYGGALNNSYDFDVILTSFLHLQNQYSNIKLIFIGGGELEHHIKEFITKNTINALVTGRIPYPDFLKWLAKCDIAINSFRGNTLVAHSYKYNDYIASGCCVLNNLKGETWSSIVDYGLGLNFDYENNTLENCLQELLSKPELIEKCKANSKHMANNDLSKEHIYNLLFEKINSFL